MESSHKEPASIRMEGYLQKKGEDNPMWKRRYFVLENSVLSYFLDHHKTKLFGKIYLREVTWIRPSPPGVLGGGILLGAGGGDQGFYFQIDTPKRQYLLYADSKEEMQRWIDVLVSSKKSHEGHNNNHLSPEHDQSFHHRDDDPTTVAADSSASSSSSRPPQLSNLSSSSAAAVLSSGNLPRTAGMNSYALLLQQQQALHQQQLAQYHSQLRFEQSLFRRLTEQPNQFLFSEGLDLKQYMDWYTLHLDLLIKGETVESLIEKRRMVCVYVGLKALEQDVNRTGLPYALGAFFTRPLELVSKELMQTWGTANASAILAKTESWARRDQSPPLLAPDLESVCKWTLLCLHHLRTQFLPNDSIHIPINHSIDQFTDKLLDTLEKLPTAHYAQILWQEVLKKEPNLSHQYRSIINAFLVLGKLQLENSQWQFPPSSKTNNNNNNNNHNNEYSNLHTEYNRVVATLNEAFRESPLSRLESTVRSFSQQIFASWQATIQLLGMSNGSSTSESGNSAETTLLILFQKNLRILRRVSVGLNGGHYDKLRKALVDCANLMELKVRNSNSTTLRKQTAAGGEELLYDLLQHLENASAAT